MDFSKAKDKVASTCEKMAESFAELCKVFLPSEEMTKALSHERKDGKVTFSIRGRDEKGMHSLANVLQPDKFYVYPETPEYLIEVSYLISDGGISILRRKTEGAKKEFSPKGQAKKEAERLVREAMRKAAEILKPFGRKATRKRLKEYGRTYAKKFTA